MFTKGDVLILMIITSCLSYRAGYNKAREKALESIVEGLSTLKKKEKETYEASATRPMDCLERYFGPSYWLRWS